MSSLDPTRLAEVFEYLETVSDELTDWEREFVQSVYEQWDERRRLTTRQLEVLDDIYSKH